MARRRDEVELFDAGEGRELLLGGLWGLEREALRVDQTGQLAEGAHPFPPEKAQITVDFAENQVEFVTAPWPTIEETLGELEALHGEAYGVLGDELLWPLSVPGRWDRPELLKPASFAGRAEREAARAYRAYLLTRYGRARQAISGLHYNFSFSGPLWDFLRQAEGSREDRRSYSDRRYMGLARNFLRYRFLPAFLLAASPALEPAFGRELLAGAEPSTRAVAKACSSRFASLRSGPLGYRLDSRISALVDARFDSLDGYLGQLESALLPRGTQAPLLRSAAEFYAPLRPKGLPSADKGSLDSLRSGGIEYLELRIFDLDPFEPTGIGADAARFTQLFALACLLSPSPPLGRGAADDGPLDLAVSACSFDPAGREPEPRIRRRVALNSRPIMELMSRLAQRLPAEYGNSLEWARGLLEGRNARAAERFAARARDEGGSLAAGLSLAREHRRRILESDRAEGAKEDSAWAS